MGDSTVAERPRVFSDAQARFLLYLGGCIAPGVRGLDAQGHRRFRRIIRRMLLRRSGTERLQIRLFLAAIRWAPAIVFFRPFERIPHGAQTWVLRHLEDAPLKLLRAGFWGIKTLLFMGYYGQPHVARSLHYLPDLRHGNDRLARGQKSAS